MLLAAQTPTSKQDLPEVTETVQQTLVTAWESFLSHTPYLVAGTAIIIGTWLLTKASAAIAKRGLKKSKFRKSLQDLLVRLATIAVWVAGLMLAAVTVFPGLSPTKALSGLGLMSVAVGFAFKDIFENFFAGFILLWRYPFEDGDYIECEGVEGKIESINLRMSEIRQTTGELVVVPNSILFSNPVDVLTDLPRRRASIEVGVSYDTDVEQAVGLIQETVEDCDLVMTDQPVQIFPKAFGSSSIDIEVAWWTDPKPLDVRKSRAEVVTKIKRALDDAGIEIPFPYRTLTFKESLTLARPDADGQTVSQHA